MRRNFYISLVGLPLAIEKPIIILIPLLLNLISYLRSSKLNHFYLHKAEIDLLSNKLNLDIFKHDHFLKRVSFNLHDIKFTVKEISNGLTMVYQIDITSSNASRTLLYKQASVGDWSKTTFLEMYKALQDFKGEYAYIPKI